MAKVEPDLPLVPLSHLDDLWFQVTGTLCNLACSHCFVSCHPHNHSLGFLSFETIKHYLEESLRFGVKEYYFTGGEPFLHPDMTEILATTLRYGPATVLTNGTLFKDDSLHTLHLAEYASPFSLEFRVSLDGVTPAENDALRGHGTFDRILRGIQQLIAHDFLPIVTVARTGDDQDEAGLFDDMVRLLRSIGCARPRIKIMPTLRIGAEVQRHRGYFDDEIVTAEMMESFDRSTLLCDHGRIVSERGVHVCPILVEAPDSVLGRTLAEADRPYPLKHRACFTCYQHGALCSNPSAQRQ